MPQTRTVIAVLALLVFCMMIVKGQESKSPSNSQVGRFQLVQGNFIADAGGKPFADRTVFKIDTVTGQSWQYVTGSRGDKFYREWFEVADTPGK